jgi:hypothetical protein
MAFIKHIGRHSDRKVAVIFRQIPGDEHMCLVIYPDLLPVHIHDPIMKILESPVGQQEEELANALHRNLLPDGRNMLHTLHSERLMKRVNTEQIIMTPNSNSTVKLNELNKILNEMKLGTDAIKKMSELDESAGLVDPKVKRQAEAQFKAEQAAKARGTQPSNGYLAAPPDGALDDKTLAANMLAQAERMHNEATSMINEAARMRKEAERMFPSVRAAQAPAETSDSSSAPTESAPPKRGRGRPSKAAVPHAAQ